MCNILSNDIDEDALKQFWLQTLSPMTSAKLRTEQPVNDLFPVSHLLLPTAHTLTLTIKNHSILTYDSLYRSHGLALKITDVSNVSLVQVFLILTG